MSLHALLGAAQDVARVALVRVALGRADVGEHPRDAAALVLRPPRQHRERRRVGHRDHVGLLDRVEAGDRGAVETHPALERVVELGRVDRERLQLAEDVGEPEPDEADAALVGERLDVVGRAGRVHGRGSVLEPLACGIGPDGTGRALAKPTGVGVGSHFDGMAPRRMDVGTRDRDLLLAAEAASAFQFKGCISAGGAGPCANLRATPRPSTGPRLWSSAPTAGTFTSRRSPATRSACSRATRAAAD